ncbi:glycosyltransferase family 62 protein [Babjeviella inositovora NRRL Y-12698]|uniref:Glycosyltransferase family 62 protein n=1 Tax=Babjeviella inositovora NRRL Y-12698 TaxID=984486 RepID=A0A1E3QL69_9ASCO|nr:glycosyltransferase family 62 protein [Babjeviella inositovora NRRL Y-12698]ODQ78433.1 glycosyltransferase family 62 protein [Babjeviella inositovora NRRL Y-12698]
MVNYTHRSLAEVDTGKNILFLLSIGPSNAYGEGRTFEDLLNFLHATEYPTEKLSLGLLIVNKEEFEAIDKRITQYYEEATPSTKKFQSIKLLYAPFLESSTLDREERHHNDKQKERRRTLARARNYLLYNTMDHQDYVLWIDADIISLPDRILTTFVESDRDIITIRITQGNQNDYDRNAWVGARAKPSSEQLAQMKNDPKYVYVPHNSGDTKNLAVFANGKEEFVELDSVGGTVLFVKAEIHKQGVSHTPYYAIGTDFGIKEGYDGIETEGLCYVAQALGYKCWGMPLVTGEHVL